MPDGSIRPMDLWPIIVVCSFVAGWLGVTRWRAARRREHLRHLALANAVTASLSALAFGGMLLVLKVPWPAAAIALMSWCALALTAWVTGWLIRGADRSDARTVGAFLSERVAAEKRRTMAAMRQLVRVTAPDGWGDVRVTLNALDDVMSMSTLLRVTGVLYLMIMTFSVVRLLATAREANAWQRSLISTALWYNVLAIACLLSLTALVTLFLLLVGRWIGIFASPIGLTVYCRQVATWIGYGGAVGAVLAALLPFAALVSASTLPSDDGSSLLHTITPQALLDFPATGAVIGYALGLVIASASVFPASRNVWLRRVVGPSVFAIALCLLSNAIGGLRGLMTPVIDAAARHSRIDTLTCANLQPPAASADDIDMIAWSITAMERCGSGLMIPGTAVSVAGVITAALVVVTLIVSDIRVRSRQIAAEDEARSMPKTSR